MLERTSLCMSGPTPNVATHVGDEYFPKIVSQHYSVAENNATEHLVRLKHQLRESTTFDFWRMLMEGMTAMTGAQYGFVAKRILVDDSNSAVEMPGIGEPGSCLLGVAFYYNDGHEICNLHRDYKYLAYGAPCSNMKHDKVFLIPNGLQDFITNNPNNFPFPTEAYIGVPLFAEGKCFAHFGMMWTIDGVKKLQLGWGFIEMLLHSLEDVIKDRLVDGQSFVKEGDPTTNARVIPHEAVTAAQSLKPYARSLSHELRTPMQGVVGMSDVMHATVSDLLEMIPEHPICARLNGLRKDIEIIQDSSRRAVEAADNVVHAYDMNMTVPDTPITEDENTDARSLASPERRSSLLHDGHSIFQRKNKRLRTASTEVNDATQPSSKHRAVRSTNSTPRRDLSPHSASLRAAVEESDEITNGMEGVLQTGTGNEEIPQFAIIPQTDHDDTEVPEMAQVSTPGLRHTKIRDLLRLLVNECLKLGGRPDSAFAEDTEHGESIEVRTTSSKGVSITKTVDWTVDPRVPESIYGKEISSFRVIRLMTILVDERDLLKLISCVFLNAVKFTETGRISMNAALSPRSRTIVIHIVDTGPGIPRAFIPSLFKPFSREDDSLTRRKEGLGLGLLVAKGLARKLGGDLLCARSETSGSSRGSDFEIRIPISTPEHHSRASTPAATASSPSKRIVDRSPVPSKRVSSTPKRESTRGSKLSVTPKPPTSNSRKATSPLAPSTPSRRNSTAQAAPAARLTSSKKKTTYDRNLAKKHPLTFLVAEDNQINRQLLVSMLSKLGYSHIYEAENGEEAVQQMSLDRRARREKPVDVILMDLWMPNMDGYEATEKIKEMEHERRRQNRGRGDESRSGRSRNVNILAVSADVTGSALERAKEVGMNGFLTKPFKLMDLERLILDYCTGDEST